MAILHADNFNIYGTNTGFMTNGVYANAGAVALGGDPDGISSTRCLRLTPSGASSSLGSDLRYVLQNGAEDTIGLCARVWFPSLPESTDRATRPFTLCNTSNGAMFNLQVMPDGRLRFQTGGDNRNLGTEIISTAIPVVTANGWYHIEMKVVISDTVGTVEVRVEGQPVIDEENLNLGTTPIGIVRANNYATNTGFSQTFYMKDLVVWDANGTYNTDFLGSVLVTNLAPTSDVALNWTPSTGSDGYSILDNIPPVDATYIYAEDDPVPSPYVATLSDLPDEVTSVKAVITYVRAAKSDGGDGSLQVGIISDPDGTPATGLGQDRPITVAQTYWRDVFEEDPATTAPWLPDAVNEAQLQINRTT